MAVENNFFKATKPAINLSKVFGILPFSYINDKIVVFKYTFVYNVGVIILSIWFTFKVGTSIFKENIVEAITDITLLSVNELQLIVTFSKAVVNKDDWLDLAYAMIKIDKLFTAMDMQLPDRKLTRTMYLYLISMVVIIGSGFTIEMYTHAYRSRYEIIYMFSLVVFQSVLNCCVGMHLFRVRDGFMAVNAVLKERIDAEKSRNFRMPLRLLLSSACKIHHNLTKIIWKFNGCFGIILLTIVTASFLVTINALNECYKAIKEGNTLLFISAFIYCFMYARTVIFFCYLSDATVEEVLDKLSSTNNFLY